MKLIIKLLFTLSLVSFTSGACAQGLYAVNNIKTSATAVNAKKAREIAIENGQIEAFMQLTAEANLSASQISKSKEDILNAAREYQVVDESMTKSSYKASMNVYFSQNHVNKILANENINIGKLSSLKNYLVKASVVQNTIATDKAEEKEFISDQEPVEIIHKKLIIPIASIDGASILWSDQNLWFKVWQEYAKLAEDNNIIVPLGDLEDISLTKFNILLASYNSFKPLLDHYGADDVLIAFAEIKRDRSVGGYKVSISMKNLTAKHDHNFLKKYFDYSGSNRETMLTEGFYKVVNSRSEKLYDIKNLEVQISDNITLDAIFNINNFSDWIALSTALNKVNSIMKFSIVEFNDKTLIVNIISKSDILTLKKNVAKRGYEIFDREGKFIIRLDK